MDDLVTFEFSDFAAAHDLRGELTDFALGSKNLMPLGTRQYRPFRGLTLVGNGSRRLFPVKDTYGGLDDVAGQEASGSLFSTLADALVFVGYGQVSIEGSNLVGIFADNLLQILLKWNGSYTDANSGPFQVGLPEPSRPEVGILDEPIAGGAPVTNGLYSFKVARLRGATGGKSRASATSDVLNLVGKAAYIVLPIASSGQTIHPVFVTEKGLGGVGLHLRMSRANPFTGAEYTEEDVERSVSTLSVTNGSPIVTDSLDGFTAQDEGKLFRAVSIGWSVPAGTTVLSVDADDQITLSNNVTVASGSNPRTARFTAYVNSIERAVSLNWTESDLAGEAAEISWLYDFPPPPASHAFQLENRIAVAAYADSSAETDAQNPGTALVFSLSNQLESFDIRFPLYLPEAVVDILGRGVDSYRFIGCRNGIYAVQYINAEIPATLSIMMPNEGIANANNWCLGKRGLYIMTAKGKLVRIGEGGAIDDTFYDKIRLAIRDWLQEDTVLSAETRAGGVVLSNGRISYYYDEQTAKWSTDLYIDETGSVEAGSTVVSALGIRGRMIICTEPPLGESESEGDIARSAFEFDAGSGSNIVGIAPYYSPAEIVMAVQQIAARFIVDRTDTPAYIGIHQNLMKTHLTDVSMGTGTSSLDSESADFDSSYVGAYILVQGAGPVSWLFGRIKAVTDQNTIVIGTPEANLADSVPLTASFTVANGYALIAHRIFAVNVTAEGTIQIKSPEMHLNGFRRVAASVVLDTDGVDAQVLKIDLFGYAHDEDWNYGGATWQ